MTDLVVISLEGWDEVWRRNQHLIAGLLRTNPGLQVLFVEPPADPLHALASGRRPSFGRRLTEIPDVAPGRLWRRQPVKWLPRRFDSRADERLARSVMKTVRRRGMQHPLLWINDPSASTLSKLTGWPTLYDMTDDWLSADRPAAELSRVAAAEEYLLSEAAEVVACSPELVRRKAPRRPSTRSPIALIPNAVDADTYRRPAARPSDLPDGLTAVYVGTLHEDRIDVALCEKAARGRAALVLVGPNALTSDSTRRLQDAGALLLGSRSHEAVVGYLQHATILVVPHVVTDFTESLDPIKLYEYLAVDRPIVSTPVAGFRDVDDPRVSIADTAVFPASLDRAVVAPFSTTTPSAHVADWKDRVTSMAAIIGRLAR